MEIEIRANQDYEAHGLEIGVIKLNTSFDFSEVAPLLFMKRCPWLLRQVSCLNQRGFHQFENPDRPTLVHVAPPTLLQPQSTLRFEPLYRHDGD